MSLAQALKEAQAQADPHCWYKTHEGQRCMVCGLEDNATEDCCPHCRADWKQPHDGTCPMLECFNYPDDEPAADCDCCWHYKGTMPCDTDGCYQQLCSQCDPDNYPDGDSDA